MSKEKILEIVRENLEALVMRDSPLGISLWEKLLSLHPADIADLIDDLDRESGLKIFKDLPRKIRNEVFENFSNPLKVESLEVLSESDEVDVLRSLGADELTDLFDYFSDEDLKKYLNILHKKERQKVLALMKFDPESAGGIMDIDVLSLEQDFTVDKSTKILQRLGPKQEVHREIYVTDKDHRLEGHILLVDLLLQKPKTRISEFMKKNELVAQANEDREDIAKKMVHYGFMTVPVVNTENYFLGVIPSDKLVDVISQEATEDMQKMSALSPMKESYFDTPMFRILYKRGNILIVLLLAESISSVILKSYEHTMPAYMLIFITMLISTGGNTSHQTSTLVIQGMASGEVHSGNMVRFLRRELFIAFLLAVALGITAFIRAYYIQGEILPSFVVAFTLGTIVMTAVALGSFIPLMLKRFRIDPAFSAGPFLATMMDIVGVLIYAVLVKMFLL